MRLIKHYREGILDNENSDINFESESEPANLLQNMNWEQHFNLSLSHLSIKSVFSDQVFTSAPARWLGFDAGDRRTEAVPVAAIHT